MRRKCLPQEHNAKAWIVQSRVQGANRWSTITCTLEAGEGVMFANALPLAGYGYPRTYPCEGGTVSLLLPPTCIPV